MLLHKEPTVRRAYSTVQYRTVLLLHTTYSKKSLQYSTIQYSTVQYSTVLLLHTTYSKKSLQYSTVQYSTGQRTVWAWKRVLL